jgi:hypothetical protein
MACHFCGCRNQSGDKPLNQQGPHAVVTGAWIQGKTIRGRAVFQDLKREHTVTGIESATSPTWGDGISYLRTRANWVLNFAIPMGLVR